ncbi:MAG: DUF4293 domain-containing protein [Prevotella sp.]|jgi:hypothetical protein
MLQRKQTVFLFLATIAFIVCLILPVGSFEPKGMSKMAMWYNLGINNGETIEWHIGLFALLAVDTILSFVTIFLYHQRKTQIKLCVVSMLIVLAWYICYAIGAMNTFASLGAFHFQFGACLPLVALILLWLARRGVKADEELVRSMDRIR